MKNWKLIVAILAIFGFTVAFIACDDNNNGPCNCFETYGTIAHLGTNETCTCGGKDCNCTIQIDTLAGIPIRKQIGVTVQQMNIAVGKINDAYTDDLGETEQGTLAQRINLIYIIPGNTATRDGTTLNIGVNATQEDIAFCFVIAVS